MGVHGELDLDFERGLLLHAAFQGGAVVGDRLAHHPYVEIEADAGDMAGLFTAEEVARAADLQVLHGDVHARTHLGVLGDGRQPLVRGLGQRLLRRVEEVGVAALAATAHPPAQLVELGEAEVVAALDDQGVGVGDVDARFDDRRRDQDVELLLPEVDDDLLQLGLAHLSVGGLDTGLGDDLAEPGGGPVDGLHPVVDVEDLALAQEFTADGGADLLLLVRPDEGQDRVALLGRGGDRGHLADARHRHLQGAGDGGGGHGEDVDVGAELLQLLLVLDAEPLLLVDDDQAQVLELGLGGEEAVGADDEVDGAVPQPFEDGLGLGVGLEAGERPDVDRELAVALGERAEVLLDEEGGRDQDRHLLAVLDGLEGGTDRDLGLAVADVAADQAVHGDRLLHVLLDLGDGGELVGRLRVREGVLQLALPGGVRAEGVAGCRHPRGVQLDEVGGDLLDGLLGARLGLGPVGAAEPVQGGGLAAHVLGDLLQLVGGDVEAVAGLAALGGGVLDEEVFAGGALDRALHHLDVAAHAVLLVDDEVARFEGERVDGLAAAGRHPGAVLAGRLLAGEVGLGEDGELERRVDEAVVEGAAGDMDDGRGDLGEVGVQAGGDALAAEDLDRTGRRAVALGEEQRAPAVRHPLLGVGQCPLGVTAVGVGGMHAQLEGVAARRQLLIGREGADRPPHHPQLARPVPDVREAPQGGRAHIDRRRSPAGAGRPGRLEELLAGRHQVGGPGAYPLRVAHHRHAPGRQHVQQQLHVVHQDRSQRLHALDGDPLGDLAEQFAQLGMLLGERGGPLPHLVGQQQLTARRRPQAVFGDLQGPLVGDLEVADLLDVVAPELHPQGVLLGRREDIQDAAADRELAALLDQLDARVRGRRQAVDDLFEVGALAGAQTDGIQLTQALDLRLEHGADGGDDDGDGPGGGVVLARVGEPAQHREAPADGVRARGEPLVRQRLPGRELHDGVVLAGRHEACLLYRGPPPPGRWRSPRAPGGRPPGRARRPRAGGRPAARPGPHAAGSRRSRPGALRRAPGPVRRRRADQSGSSEGSVPARRTTQQPDTSHGPGLPSVRPPATRTGRQPGTAPARRKACAGAALPAPARRQPRAAEISRRP